MEVWFISVAVKVVQLESKSHIISFVLWTKPDRKPMQFMKRHCVTLCSAFQLDLPPFSCAVYALNFVMPQTVKLVH